MVAGAIATRFPAERLLRSLVLAHKDHQILYVDVICAAERGAAYRLLCDIVAQARRETPGQNLVVVLMAVVSSEVLACYGRWGFSYGGVVERGNQGARRPRVPRDAAARPCLLVGSTTTARRSCPAPPLRCAPGCPPPTSPALRPPPAPPPLGLHTPLPTGILPCLLSHPPTTSAPQGI